MIHVDQAVVVEGKYDKIKLSSILDAVILTTDGFGIFNNKEKTALIRMIAKKSGLIVITDSDGGGRMIRNFIRNICAGLPVKHLYIPQIKGKEKRKISPSKEAYLGVEGMPKEQLITLFGQTGITYTHQDKDFSVKKPFLTKTLLYADGLSGAAGAVRRREALAQKMGLPKDLSTAALTEAVNLLFTEEEYENALNEIYVEKEGILP